MLAERWQRIEEIFLEAAEQPASVRADFLERACGSDAGMRDEVVSLLTAVEQSGDFLSTPALDVFARQISCEGWSVQPGDRIAAYTVGQRLGVGGMGEVWRAHDERLGRDVAIKLLLPHPSNADERVGAFQREARAASALNHPNVLTVYDVGNHGGAPYLVTECLEGEPLRAHLAAGALALDEALDIAAQTARGLDAAHGRGIVHRDLKPENIFLTLDGRVKILDFGLATLRDSATPAALSPELPATTTHSLAAGTAGYMAPEQVRGELVDRRADIFALGVVLYEMLAGRRPFQGDSTLETLSAVLTLQPPSVADVSREIPPALSHLVQCCLEKSPDDRLANLDDFVSVVESVIRARSLPPPALLAFFRRPAVMVSAMILLLAIAAGGWRWRAVTSRVRWAHAVAAPEVQRLSNRGDHAAAFLLVRQALEVVPEDPHLRQLWLDVSIPVALITEPAGADVAFTSYRTPGQSWFPLGLTPLDGVRIPRSPIRMRISKAGFESIEVSGSPGGMRYRLDPVGAVPPGMVRVTRGRDLARSGPVGEVDDFWMDRFEITNRQFQEFVDRGAYGWRDLWREPFIDRGRNVSWEEAVARFRDASGRPGPAAWTSGRYPAGQADSPVEGVSWYEATAYARFAGKSLPTMHHWYRAAALGRFADVLTVSNFSGKGPAPVGSHGGLGTFGTYDMAGNVKEWCSTETNGQRFLLGGAWNEPRYMFGDFDAKEPFERAPGYGIRLVKYIAPLSPAVTAPVAIETLVPDGRNQKPVGDDVFAVYRRLYAYDRAPLNALIEAREETELYVKHTVALDAAYDGERMRVSLFLPRKVSPPYQAVIFFPAADAFQLRSSHDMSLAWGDFLLRSGRAFVYPIYKGTYERQTTSRESGPNADRELQTAWAREFGRVIDYLGTRSDIDRDRLAFYGVSAGADAGVILTALEARIKASVLQGTGLAPDLPPETNPVNYATRIRMPTLMLNGRYDFGSPVETTQRPLFRLLGTAAENKRLVIFESGHALPMEDVAREILPWLDRFLGTVVRPSPASAPIRSER